MEGERRTNNPTEAPPARTRVLLENPVWERFRQEQAETAARIVHDERESKHARKFISRALFAWTGALVFLCGLAGLGWRYAVAAMLLLMLVCVASILSHRALWLNSVLIKPTIRSNNRWLGWMGAMTVTLLVVLIMTPMGGHRMVETVQATGGQISVATQSDRDQRMSNLKKFGRYETDAEMGNKQPSLPVERAKPAQAVPVDLQWETWKIRATSFLTLALMTLIYGVFFAYRDEAFSAVYKSYAKIKEEVEGETIKSAATNVATAAATAAATKGGSIATEAVRQVGWEAAIEGGKRVWRRIKRAAR